MTWTPVTSILLKTDWQYTEPIVGSYFKLKHSSFPANNSYLLGQAQVNPDNSVELSDIQELSASSEAEVICLKSPPVWGDRRLAIKRIAKQPSITSELRQIIRNDLLTDSENEFIIRRSAWSVAIEKSDYVEPVVGGSTTAPVPTTLPRDTFTDSNGVLLTNHAMDVGSGWVSPQAFWNIQENKVRAGTITGSGGVIYTDAGRSDVRVECDITFWNGGVNSQQGLLIRGIDTNNYIFCRYVYADNSLRISKNVGGGQSDVTSKNYPIPLGTTKRIAVEAVGSTIKVYADSVLELTGTTSDLNTGAKCGLWVFEAGTNNTVWDNFLVLLPSN